MALSREQLISRIIDLDAETFGGIDDPSYLSGMSAAQLQKHYDEMLAELGEDNPHLTPEQEDAILAEGDIDYDDADRAAYRAEQNERWRDY